MPFGLPYAGDGSRITDLILRAGDIRARGAAERGDILGQTISGLGQLAGQTFADAQEQQRKKAAAAAEGEFITAAQQEGFDINAALQGMAPELRPQAMAIYSKLEDAKAQRDTRRQEAEKRKAEIAQLESEAQEHDDYRNALGADVLLNALGTPGEANARNAVLGYFAQEDPETIAQIKDLPGEQLRPILERFRSGSNLFLKEREEIASKQAERGFKEREVTSREAAEKRQEQERIANEAYRQQQLGLGYAQLAETKRGHDLDAAAKEAALKAKQGEAGKESTATEGLIPSLTRLKELSDKIITGEGLSQRAKAFGRKGAAALGYDPDMKTFQDLRSGFAVSLAVAAQGSRPSDADVFRAALPQVPGPEDTAASAKQKWANIAEIFDTRLSPEAKARIGWDAKMKSILGSPSDIPAVGEDLGPNW